LENFVLSSGYYDAYYLKGLKTGWGTPSSKEGGIGKRFFPKRAGTLNNYSSQWGPRIWFGPQKIWGPFPKDPLGVVQRGGFVPHFLGNSAGGPPGNLQFAERQGLSKGDAQ